MTSLKDKVDRTPYLATQVTMLSKVVQATTPWMVDLETTLFLVVQAMTLQSSLAP